MEAKRRNQLAFFVLGVLTNFFYSVLIAAAEDLASGHAGAILLADILPVLLVKATAMLWVGLVSYNVRAVLVTLCNALAIVFVVSGSDLSARIAGVILASAGSGIAEVSMLAQTSFYMQHNCLVPWAAGTGFSGIVSGVWYLVGREMLNHSASAVLASTALMVPLFWLSHRFLLLPHEVSEYATLDDDNAGNTLDEQVAFVIDNEEERDDVQLDSLEDYDPFRQIDLEVRSDSRWQRWKRRLQTAKKEKQARNDEFPTLASKLRLVREHLLFPYMSVLFLVYFAEYTINQGVLSAMDIALPGVEDTHAFYVLANMVYQCGVFVSRSSRSVYRIRSQRLWLLAALQLNNLFLLALNARFDLVRHATVILPVVFFEGLLGGLTYANGFAEMALALPESKRELALSIASAADATGISLAAIISVFLEPALRKSRQ
ncbi:MAG: hypothetical protein MHM6MM_005426 [Cercozoa sp. M6MM]